MNAQNTCAASDEIADRAQQNDRQLAEMDPADTFTLKLRGYQKQALLCVLRASIA